MCRKKVARIMKMRYSKIDMVTKSSDGKGVVIKPGCGRLPGGFSIYIYIYIYAYILE